MLASVPPTGRRGLDVGVGAADAERLVPGVVVPDGGGGMSVLSTRVAFFFGLGAGVSSNESGRQLQRWDPDSEPTRSEAALQRTPYSPFTFSLM